MTEPTPIAESSPPSRRATGLALVGGIVFALAEILYLVLLRAQGVQPPTSPVPIEMLLGALAVAAVAGGLVRARRLRLTLLSLASVAGLGLAVLSLFSIGLLLLVGAAAVVGAGVTTWNEPLRSEGSGYPWLGAGLALAALALVFGPSTGPSVVCRGGDPVFSSGWGPWSGPSQGSFSVSGTVSRAEQSGSAVVNGRTYRFTCRGDKLVSFSSHG